MPRSRRWWPFGNQNQIEPEVPEEEENDVDPLEKVLQQMQKATTLPPEEQKVEYEKLNESIKSQKGTSPQPADTLTKEEELKEEMNPLSSSNSSPMPQDPLAPAKAPPSPTEKIPPVPPAPKKAVPTKKSPAPAKKIPASKKATPPTKEIPIPAKSSPVPPPAPPQPVQAQSSIQQQQQSQSSQQSSGQQQSTQQQGQQSSSQQSEQQQNQKQNTPPAENPMRYIPPPLDDLSKTNEVFSNTKLPSEYALLYRNQVHASKPNSNALIFTAKNTQEIGGILQILMQLKQNPKQPLPPQLPSSFRLQGYINQQGQPTNDFVQKIHNRPQIEIILEHAVLVMNQEGMAYVDSKGTPIDQQIAQALQQQVWTTFYDIQGDQQQKIKKAQDNSHFHTVKQQDDNDDYSNVDKAIANLDTLNNIAASDDTLNANAKKTSRRQLIQMINGQPDPTDPNNNSRLNLIDRSNERRDEQQRNERKIQNKTAERWHDFFHEEAKQQQKQVHGFRQKTNDWVEVFLEKPPEYVLNESDLNKWETKHKESGIVNSFEYKEEDIVVTSKKGDVTYAERFTRIAEDLYVAWQGNLPPTIVINAITPPSEEREKECLAAFKKVFVGCDVHFNKENSEAASDAVHATPLLGSPG